MTIFLAIVKALSAVLGLASLAKDVFTKKKKGDNETARS